MATGGGKKTALPIAALCQQRPVFPALHGADSTLRPSSCTRTLPGPSRDMAKSGARLRDKMDGNELDLSLADLNEVPVKELAALPKATILDLSCNKLTSLPSEFCGLTHLVKLDLSKNKLQQLPLDFGRLVNLQHLDLLSNKLVTLPVSFAQLKSLKWLDLKDNPLDPVLAKVAGDCLDEKQCKQSAVRVLQHMKAVQADQDQEKQRRLQAERENEKKREARQRAREAQERERRKKEKVEEKERRRREYDAMKATKREPEKKVKKEPSEPRPSECGGRVRVGGGRVLLRVRAVGGNWGAARGWRCPRGQGWAARVWTRGLNPTAPVFSRARAHPAPTPASSPAAVLALGPPEGPAAGAAGRRRGAGPVPGDGPSASTPLRQRERRL
uniref:Leucine-rich repeat-containing protein 59 n=1 Tax=Ornithorhynchus anatinus TaxID=9258 RepID=A0A6I8PGZ7_ORNAN